MFGGKRILVVEDEALLGLMVRDYLQSRGCEVLGIAMLGEAEKAAAGLDFDAAVVDINLHGRRSYSVIDILRGRGVPFVIVTGYGLGDLPAELRPYPLLAKPYDLEELGDALAQALCG